MFQGSSVIVKVFGGLFLLLLLSSFSLVYFHTKSMSAMDMTMRGCPFMNDVVPVLCTMSPLEHIEAWQYMFLALPVAFVLLLCLAVFVSFLYFPKWLPVRLRVFQLILSYTTKKSKFQSYIQEAFSKGILNPKLF